MKATRTITWGGLIALAAWSGACSAGKEYDIAQKAEQRGAMHEAYDNYLKAARKNSGHGGTIQGLKRTGPAASAYWEAEAIVATDEGRYEEAWRMWMRALDIRPDHPTAPHMIRQLETQHGDMILVAKADYLRRGPVVLAQIQPSGKVQPADTLSSPVLAMANGHGEKNGPLAPNGESPPPAPLPEPVLSQTDGPREVSASSSSEAIALAEPPQKEEVPPAPVERSIAAPEPKPSAASGLEARSRSSTVVVSPKKPAASAPPKPAPEPPRVAMRSAQPRQLPPRRVMPSGTVPRPAEPPVAAPTAPPAVTPVAPPVATPVAKAPPPPPVRESAPPPAAQPAPPSAWGFSKSQPVIHPPAPPSAAPLIGDYLVVRTVSKKDRRYPEELDLLDGIRMKLRDTDDDLDVDLDLLLGKERIMKIRGMALGKSCIFRGRSGAFYRLTVMDIQHKTRTARIGIKGA